MSARTSEASPEAVEAFLSCAHGLIVRWEARLQPGDPQVTLSLSWALEAVAAQVTKSRISVLGGGVAREGGTAVVPSFLLMAQMSSEG